MHGVGRELYQYPELLERYTLVLEQIKAKTLLETKNDKTEPFLLWEYHEKAGYFGKNNDVGQNRIQQEKRKSK